MGESKSNEIDSDFKQIGEFGPYQALIFVLVGLTAIIPALLTYSYVFISGTPEFRCKIEGYDNDTYEIIDDNHKYLIDSLIPIKSNSNQIEYESCLAYYNKTFHYSNQTNQFLIINNQTKITYTCKSWVFSNKYYGKTIVTDWKLLCGNVAVKSTFSTLYFIGTYGCLLTGVLSDKLGRKRTAYMFTISNVVVAISTAIVLNVNFISLDLKKVVYGILRLLSGISQNIYGVAVVLAIEVTGPKYRVVAANSIYYFYILGEYICVCLCYFIRDYNHIYTGLAAIMTLYVFYFWIVPESPRWLLAHEKYKDAYKILKRIADSNKRTMPDKYEMFLLKQTNGTTTTANTNTTNTINNKNSENEDDFTPMKPLSFSQTFSKICKSKKLLIRTISIVINWLTNNLVYYGITLGTGQLAGDPYFNFTLLTTIELIAIISSQFAFEKLGRKIPYVINMTIAGIALLVIMFIPKSMPTLTIIMALIGKFTISFTYNGIYIITSEIYPTIIRNSAVSASQAIARFGAVISPYINLLGEVYWYPMPYIIYGGFALLASVLTFIFIPETKNKKLPEKFEDID